MEVRGSAEWVVLAAEVVKHFLPRLVDIHNYSAAHSVAQKKYNWTTLNSCFHSHLLAKVLKKIGMQISKNDIEAIVNCDPDAIERVLKVLQAKVLPCPTL